MPGFPKSATTWLGLCLSSAFSPQRICNSTDPRRWTHDAGCMSPFLVPPISTSSTGATWHRKETFFFNNPDVYSKDLRALTGPDPRGSTVSSARTESSRALEELPALWLWGSSRRRQVAAPGELGRSIRVKQARRLELLCRGSQGTGQARVLNHDALMRKKALHKALQSQPQPLCSASGADRLALCAPKKPRPAIPRGRNDTCECTHPGCVRIRKQEAASWDRCRWHADLPDTNAFCINSATPWLRPHEATLRVIDFTPNYLCDPDAMRRIFESSLAPTTLRFIVLLRDPIMRSFSEWSMFTLGWLWDNRTNFSQVMREEAEKLRACNQTLGANPRQLPSLSTAELAAYIRSCFGSGLAMNYLQSSMYAVCILHAFRYFSPRQFLFVRYEDLIRLPTAAAVRLFGDFLGLHMDSSVIAAVRKGGWCEARQTRKAFSGLSPNSAEMLAEAAPWLEHIFKPYNALLCELLGDTFRWETSDHVRQPYSKAEKLAKQRALDGNRERKMRRRQRGRR